MKISVITSVSLLLLTATVSAQEIPSPPPVPIATFNETPSPSTLSVRTAPTTSTGQHVGVARYGNQFSMSTTGSGVQADPTSADYAVNISVRKTDFLNNDTPGEIDGLDIAARNGIGDVAAILTNVSTRQGFAAALEGVSYIVGDDNQPIIGTRVHLGSTTGLPGGYSANGLVAYAEVGTGTSAIDIRAKSNASWANAIQVRTGETAPVSFDLDGFGRLMNLGKAQSISDVRLTLGQGRTASGNSYIDLIGDTNPREYGLRIIRNGGNDGASGLIHSGAGQLNLNAADGGAVALQSAGVSRVAVNSVGVGFNGTSPIAKTILAAALPTDGTATNIAMATLINQLRATFIQYGLAQ